MFALCGVMIIVGVVYIRNAPTPVPVETAAMAAPTTRPAPPVATTVRLGAAGPTTVPRARSISLDALAREAAAQTAVPPKAPPPPPAATTTAPVTVPAAGPTTVAPPPSTTASTVAPAPPTTSRSITLSATPPPPAPGATTTSAPPPATTTTVATTTKLYAHSDSGIASWFNAPDNTCAHRTLPFGTMVKVTRIRNGAVAFCKVNDRGPTLATGRLIDLSMDTFEKLAAAEAGLIDVTIEW